MVCAAACRARDARFLHRAEQYVGDGPEAPIRVIRTSQTGHVLIPDSLAECHGLYRYTCVFNVRYLDDRVRAIEGAIEGFEVPRGEFTH